MGLESRISSPCLCDRHPSLISAHGLKTSEAVQGEAAAGFFSKNHDSSSQILNPAAEKYQAFKTKTPLFLSLRGREATEAIHLKKRILIWIATPTSRLAMTEKREAPQIPPHQASGRILRLESGLSKETSACAERCPLFCKVSAEISLEGYRVS